MSVEEKELSLYNEKQRKAMGISEEQFEKIKDFCKKEGLDVSSYLLELGRINCLVECLPANLSTAREVNKVQPTPLTKEEIIAIKYDTCLNQLEQDIRELKPEDNLFLVELNENDYTSNSVNISKSSELYFRIYKLMILNTINFIECDVHKDISLRIKVKDYYLDNITLITKDVTKKSLESVIEIYSCKNKPLKKDIFKDINKDLLNKYKTITGKGAYSDYKIIYADMFMVYNAFKEALANFAIQSMVLNKTGVY